MTQLPPELRLAIGDVTIAAAKLELALMQVIRWIDDHDWEWARAKLGTPGGPRSAVRRAFDKQPDHPQRAAVESLFSRATDLLDRRHRAVHDPIVSIEGHPEYQGLCRYWMEKNELHPISAEEMSALAQKMGDLDDELCSFRRTNLNRPTDSYQLGPNQPRLVLDTTL